MDLNIIPKHPCRSGPGSIREEKTLWGEIAKFYVTAVTAIRLGAPPLLTLRSRRALKRGSWERFNYSSPDSWNPLLGPIGEQQEAGQPFGVKEATTTVSRSTRSGCNLQRIWVNQVSFSSTFVCLFVYCCLFEFVGTFWPRYTTLCPNGTVFNQELFICDWWYKVKD